MEGYPKIGCGSTQIRRCWDNKRVLRLLLQERIFFLQNKYYCTYSDINGCVVDTHHNCSSDAFCSNTHGSFNCICKPGFTGDGENCTGSIFSGMSVLVWQQTLYLFSIVISPCCNLLLIAMQRQVWMQGRWIGRVGGLGGLGGGFLAALLVC